MTDEAAGRPAPHGLRASRRRHRGELRDQVLSAARAMIASDGPSALSMRKLAQRLDCAPMSLYTHFRDKHDLLLALAQESFNTLAARLAAEQSGPPLAALRRLFLAYARLGLERPDDYRILFMTPGMQPSREWKGPGEIYRGNAAFAVGFDRVDACLKAGLLQGDAHAIATILWTTVHGAVSAILTFPAFPFGDPHAYVERVVDFAVDALTTAHNESLGSKIMSMRSSSTR